MTCRNDDDHHWVRRNIRSVATQRLSLFPVILDIIHRRNQTPKLFSFPIPQGQL
jgi:hypothetical protein